MKKILPVIYLLLSVPLFSQTPQMLTTFRQYGEGLGAPKPESPVPQRFPAPRNYGWWQAFAQGEIYYTPTLGAHPVKEPILSLWAGAGKAQGTLGFPLYSQRRDRTGSNETVDMQDFEGGSISYNYVTRLSNITYNQHQLTPGWYRLILCGFKVEEETSDNPFQTDGKGDEIYIRTDAFLTNDNGVTTNALSYQTKIMGDINGQENRIMAGSRSDRGGLKTGDLFPGVTPWVVTTLAPSQAGGGNQLPMKIWEGEITSGNCLLVIPSIWEWDEYRPSELENNWSSMVNRVFNYAPYQYYDFSLAHDQPASIGIVNGNLPVGRWKSSSPTMDYVTVNTPIVIADRQGFYFGNRYNYFGRPANDNTHGPDIFEAVYRSGPPFGSYRLYFKWEKVLPQRIPGNFTKPKN